MTAYPSGLVTDTVPPPRRTPRREPRAADVVGIAVRKDRDTGKWLLILDVAADWEPWQYAFATWAEAYEMAERSAGFMAGMLGRCRRCGARQ